MPGVDLPRLREEVEARIAQLLQKDSFWEKCYPCRNNGRCCVDDDPPALEEELAEIESFLENNEDAWLSMLENLRQERRCLFYRAEANACLIHEVRPLICRLTPFKGHVGERGVTVFDGGNNRRCGAFLKRCPDIVAEDGPFIHTDTNVYFRINDFFDIPPRTHMHGYFYRQALAKGLL